MPSSTHAEFIMSPITDILQDAITACSGIGSGIETFPMYEYVMQSIFLKMTGFQEQKMKCICWELATDDYDYRRILLANDDKLGECSSYSDKNKIYRRLINQILRYDKTTKIEDDAITKSILKDTRNYIKEEFKNKNLSIWSQKDFNYFVKNGNLIRHSHFMTNEDKVGRQLFVNVLQDMYTVLYNNRNRIAHNTKSYQQNLPTLKSLENKDYQYENYYLQFALLVLIDKIFIHLYNEYVSAKQSNVG